MGCDGGRSKESLEPVPSERHTRIVAVIINVGLCQIDSLVSGLEFNGRAYRVPSKCRGCALRDISSKLGCINNLGATRRVRLNICVADKRIVLPVVRMINQNIPRECWWKTDLK